MRKVYVLPNMITTANMFCGFYSVVQTFDGNYLSAAWLIILATVFDALDGRVARMARATSSFGVEYDSLSDLISFGLAPAVLAYQWAMQDLGRLGWVSSFFFLMCGALRLARFNVTTETLSKAFFQGLPIPMAAGVFTTFVIFHENFMVKSSVWQQTVSLGLVLSLGLLMVSTIPFPSFKEVNWRAKSGFPVLLGGIAALLSVAVRPDLMMFVVLTGYVLCSLIWFATRKLKGKSAKEILRHAGSSHGHSAESKHPAIEPRVASK